MPYAMFFAYPVRPVVYYSHLHDQASDYFARQQVLERLQGIDLPPECNDLSAALTPIGEIYRYRLKGE